MPTSMPSSTLMRNVPEQKFLSPDTERSEVWQGKDCGSWKEWHSSCTSQAISNAKQSSVSISLAAIQQVDLVNGSRRSIQGASKNAWCPALSRSHIPASLAAETLSPHRTTRKDTGKSAQVAAQASWSQWRLHRMQPNPSIERTSPGKPGAASHVKR